MRNKIEERIVACKEIIGYTGVVDMFLRTSRKGGAKHLAILINKAVFCYNKR